MSCFPELELGFWNAWLLMLVWPLQPLLLWLVDKAAGTGDIYKKMGSMPADKKEQALNYAVMALILVLLAYAIFLPLKPGTAWFYAGLAVYLPGLAVLLTAMLNAASAPPGRPFTRGIYRYSRHPLYLSLTMLFAGTGLAAASGVFLLVTAVLFTFYAAYAGIEEQQCLAAFGEEYRTYLARTPRWLGLPKPEDKATHS